MGQVLHGNAKTTHAIRSELQRSQASVASLAKRYGINEKTVLKWRHRQSVASAERDVAIYSVIETAKLNGIEPQAYILTLLRSSPVAGPPSAGMSSGRGTGNQRRSISPKRSEATRSPSALTAADHSTRRPSPMSITSGPA